MSFSFRLPRINVRKIFTPPGRLKNLVKKVSAPVRVGALAGLTGGGSLLFSKYGQGLLEKGTSLATSIFAKQGPGENVAENYTSDNSDYPTSMIQSAPSSKMPLILGGGALLLLLLFLIFRRK